MSPAVSSRLNQTNDGGRGVQSMRQSINLIMITILWSSATSSAFSPLCRSLATAAAPAATKKKFRIFNRPHRKEGLFRADRVVANRTGKPRKDCFKLLQEKRIHDKDGNAIQGPATKILPNVPLFIDRTHAIPMPPPLLALYHKPKWVLSVRSDPKDRPCIDSVLKDMHPVGRLDYDTTGLLLFSSSGTLTQTLLHPKHAVEKEYCATVVGRVDEEALRAKLTEGVVTGEGVHTAQLESVEHKDNVKEYLEEIRGEIPESYNQTDLKLRGYMDIFEATELSVVRIVVQEGKHRMVRRILANTGHPVVSLHRERLGEISLGDLPAGATRDLSDDELHWAKSITGEKKLFPKKKGLSKSPSTKVDSTKEDSTKVDSTKVDSTKVDSTKVDSTKVDSTKVDSTK